nr:hypothetical protein [Tanacetum cinerariifolium]
MCTRSQSRHNSPQQEASPVIVEPLWIELPFLEDQFQEDPSPEVPMADNRTMAKLLQAPTEGYEDAIASLGIRPGNNFYTTSRDKFMMKAQEYVSKSFRNYDVQALPRKNIIDKIALQ